MAALIKSVTLHAVKVDLGSGHQRHYNQSHLILVLCSTILFNGVKWNYRDASWDLLLVGACYIITLYLHCLANSKITRSNCYTRTLYITLSYWCDREGCRQLLYNYCTNCIIYECAQSVNLNHKVVLFTECKCTVNVEQLPNGAPMKAAGLSQSIRVTLASSALHRPLS